MTNIIGFEKVSQGTLTPRILYHPGIGVSGFVLGNTLRNQYCASQQSAYCILQQSWPVQTSNLLSFIGPQSAGIPGNGSYYTICEVSASLLPWTQVGCLLSYYDTVGSIAENFATVRITVSSSRGVQQGTTTVENLSSIGAAQVWNDFIYKDGDPSQGFLDPEFYLEFTAKERVIQSVLTITGSMLPVGETGSIRVELLGDGAYVEPFFYPVHLNLFGEVIP